MWFCLEIDPRTGKEYYLDEKPVRYKAKEIFNIIVEHAWRTGEPGMIFLDKMNEETPQALNLKTIQEYVSSLKTILGSSSFIEQKSFLRSFVKRIELNEPQIVIDYTMPLPINGLTTTEEVLCIDKLGSRGRARTYDQPVNSRPLYR